MCRECGETFDGCSREIANTCMQVKWVEAEAPLSGLEEAVERLQAADGVRGVTVGRQASVEGHVSQELELWLGREHEGGKFDLVARSSNLVQVCVGPPAVPRDCHRVVSPTISTRMLATCCWWEVHVNRYMA